LKRGGQFARFGTPVLYRHFTCGLPRAGATGGPVVGSRRCSRDGLDRATFDEEREHHPATATAVALEHLVSPSAVCAAPTKQSRETKNTGVMRFMTSPPFAQCVPPQKRKRGRKLLIRLCCEACADFQSGIAARLSVYTVSE
jgi:hypothetical protein